MLAVGTFTSQLNMCMIIGRRVRMRMSNKYGLLDGDKKEQEEEEEPGSELQEGSTLTCHLNIDLQINK